MTPEQYFSKRYNGMYYVYLKYLYIKDMRDKGHTFRNIPGINSSTAHEIYHRCRYYPVLIHDDQWRSWMSAGLYPVTLKLPGGKTRCNIMSEIPKPNKHRHRYEAV